MESRTPQIDFQKYGAIFKALGHPVRLRMAAGLSCNECNVNKIAEQLQLPQSTVSQHLGILRTRGILELRREGTRTCYRVVDETVKQIIELLAQ